MLFERIDDDIHTARCIRRKTNFVWLSIDKLSNLHSYLFAPRKPLVPMQVGIVHHLLVILSSRSRGPARKRARCRCVEINAVLGYGKLFSYVVPVNHLHLEDTSGGPENNIRDELGGYGAKLRWYLRRRRWPVAAQGFLTWA